MSRRPIPAEAFNHGDSRRYRRGCRCRPCTDAVNADTRRRTYLRATGRSSLTTPHRAAAHIKMLRAAGMQDRDIKAAANIVADVLYRITRSEGRIHCSTERRILAVTPTKSSVGCGSHISGLGTVRRLQSLAADGWTATELARRAGKHKQFIVHLQNSAPSQVRLWVAAYVRELYSELKELTPEEAGLNPARIARGKALAASKGWLGRDYWDEEDFDDPAFQPAASDNLPRNDLAAVRRSDVEHLDSFGVSPDEIARRLGMAESTVKGIVKELRAGERRDRSKAAA